MYDLFVKIKSFQKRIYRRNNEYISAKVEQLQRQDNDKKFERNEIATHAIIYIYIYIEKWRQERSFSYIILFLI